MNGFGKASWTAANPFIIKPDFVSSVRKQLQLRIWNFSQVCEIVPKKHNLVIVDWVGNC